MKLDNSIMNENIPYDLLTRYFAGECSDEEKRNIEIWCDLDAENQKIFDQVKYTWQKSTPPGYSVNVDAALNKVTARISPGQSSNKSAFQVALAIAAVLVVGLGIFTVYRYQFAHPSETVLSTLTETSPIQYILPDGSIVTINKGSVLTFPKKFTAHERRISFEGEAYFDIVSNKEKPFIIESGNTVTRVVGTEFNFKTQADSIVQVIVTEGLVAFSLKEKSKEEILLEVGQMGEYNSISSKLQKLENSDLNFLAWKTGKFKFIDQDLKTAISRISEYYNVNFEIEDSVFDSVKFTATFDSLSIAELTANLTLILDVEIVWENETYFLKEKL